MGLDKILNSCNNRLHRYAMGRWLKKCAICALVYRRRNVVTMCIEDAEDAYLYFCAWAILNDSLYPSGHLLGAMAYEPAYKDSGDIRRRAEDKGGAFGEHGGMTPRPATHDITRIDEQENAIRIHVELPPVHPSDVIVDATGDTIDIITPNGNAREVYCSIDVPHGADVTKMEKSATRGHLELVLPKQGFSS